MALPTNRIKKVKLTDNSEYDIVPTTLQDGSTNYAATLPTLTADSTIKVESSWSTITSQYNQYSSYFAYIATENNLKEPWFATYEIVVYKKDTALTADSGAFSSVVKVMSKGGTNNKSSISVIAENATGPKSQSTTYTNVVLQHDIAVPNGLGTNNKLYFLLGLDFNSVFSFSNYEIKVRLLEKYNCSFNILSALYDIQHFPVNIGSSYSTWIYVKGDAGLQCYPSINGINVSNSNNYLSLVGTYGSPSNTDTLYRSTGLSVSSGNLQAKSYATSSEDDDDNSWYTTYRANKIYVEFGEYQGEEYGEPVYDYYEYEYQFPRKSGTLATTDDMASIELVDLTGVN